MSKEITVAGRLVFDDGKTRVAFHKGAIEIDSSGKQVIHHVQSIGTSEGALDLGDFTSLGVAMFYNRDAKNFVEIRPAAGVADFLKLKPGEFAGPMRLASDAAPRAIANTAAVELEYIIIED